MDLVLLSNEADEEFGLGRYDNAKKLLEKGLFYARNTGKENFVEFFLGELQNIDYNYKSSVRHHLNAVKMTSEHELKVFFIKNLGATLNLDKQYAKAIEWFDRALDINPFDYGSLKSKGVSLSYLNKDREAIEYYDKALEIRKDDNNLLRQKGISLSNLGMDDEAIEWFDKALKINPSDYNSIRQKGVSFSRLGDEKEAIECYNLAIEINYLDYDSIRQKGVSLSKLGHEEEAIELYSHVIEIKPDDFETLKQKGVSLHFLNRDWEAIQCYNQALIINPYDYDSYRQKGVSFSKLGKEKEAIENYNQALEINPNDSEALRLKGFSYSNLGKEELIKYYQSFEEEFNKNILFYSMDAPISTIGREEEAIDLFDRAIKINPYDYNAYRQMGISLSNLSKDRDAIECFDRALEINPYDYNSLRQKGISLSNLGMDHEAIECFDKALEIRKDDYLSLRQKGISEYYLSKYIEAIKLYDQAIKIRHNDWICLIYKCFSLNIICENLEAQELFIEVANNANHEGWINLVSLGFNLESTGKTEEAIKVFDFIGSNEDKVKDEHIISLVKFKSKALRKKQKDKSTDVLNEVINAFRKSKDDFFKNIKHIESKFMKFVDVERSIPPDFCSFLSVLRKWNSYTPILPSEKDDNKGGGYFLYHKENGIVIDPGFNFIENFYQEGFKVADIDAVLITHAHNDHTVDFESILTLVYKHNDAIKDAVKEEMEGKSEDVIELETRERLKIKGKKIDLFMNVGTFMKYSGWLNLKDSQEINSVTVMMPNTIYDLPQKYNGIRIYTTKAKHHEIIDDQYALGFILEINENTKAGLTDNEKIRIGFTGDTGWSLDQNENMVNSFKELKPQLLVAHLGSIKRKEFDYVEAKNDEERSKCFYSHHLGLLGITKFLAETRPNLTIVSEFGEELRTMRKDIVEGIGKVLNLKCLPGDIGLHIRLNDLKVYCFIERDFVDYKSIQVYTDDSNKMSSLCFHRQEISHEIFNRALDNKKKNISIPLVKRIKPN